jgi:hypothetical protein
MVKGIYRKLFQRPVEKGNQEGFETRANKKGEVSVWVKNMGKE